MKTKFGKLDLQRIALELDGRCKDMFVNNIYDVDSKSFLLKLTRPGDDKLTLMIESGVRFHMTNFVKEIPDMPSGFAMKLRKHIRQKRVLAIKQLEGDRVVDFVFGFPGSPTSEFHIILELYARGNVILTDHEYKVLSLIRYFKDVKDNEVRFAVGESYLDVLAKSQSNTSGTVTSEQLSKYFSDQLAEFDSKLSKKATLSLKQMLSLRESPFNTLGPDLIEHCLIAGGISPSKKASQELLEDCELIDRIRAALQERGDEYLAKLNDLSVPAGVLVMEAQRDDSNEQFYDRFDVFVLDQFKDAQVVQFETMNQAVDEYFSKIDMQRAAKAEIAFKAAARKKVESIKQDQQKRVEVLEEEIIMKERAAEAISHHLQNVDNAILIVRSAVASGMSWQELDEMIAVEKSRQNPIALLIDSLQLDQNQMTMKLQVEDDEKPSFVKVKLDINNSAFGNIETQYNIKKAAAIKAQRTAEVAEQVLADAEKKFAKDMDKHKQNRVVVRTQRKMNFFEKFRWFISSEGFLVLSGRDAQQNELLVKRYLRKDFGDVYVHADLHGAASCIVRSPRKGLTIPPETLKQAGAMTMCNSSAWNAKIVTSAWWVHADQVSKTAPTGEYLTTGSFMIRGKKNMLPPCRLELTFGFMFKLDETQESYDNRKIDWRVSEEVMFANEHEEETLETTEVPSAETVVEEPPEEEQLEDEKEDIHAPIAHAQRPPPARVMEPLEDDELESEETPGSHSKEKPKAQPRGKKGKMKKIKKKYGDQTDEERRLAMLALGHKEKEEKASNEPQPKSSKQVRAPKATKERKPQADVGEELEPENAEINLKSFTFNPKPDDVLLYALPFCAPPAAMTNFKYRVKLIPGSMKRGRAGKSATELLMQTHKKFEREVELLRLVPDTDLVQTMANGVKIMAPGAQSIAKSSKKGK